MASNRLRAGKHYGWLGGLILLLTVNASAAEIFVSLVGRDTNRGTQISPLRTVQHAIRIAQEGDTIILRAGTYNETVTLLPNLTIKNFPGEKPSIFMLKNMNKTVTIEGITIITTTLKGVRGLRYAVPKTTPSHKTR